MSRLRVHEITGAVACAINPSQGNTGAAVTILDETVRSLLLFKAFTTFLQLTERTTIDSHQGLLGAPLHPIDSMEWRSLGLQLAVGTNSMHFSVFGVRELHTSTD